MASNHELAINILQSIPQYVQWFEEVYGGKELYGSGKIDILKVTDAIAAFEETLTTPGSRFDQWLNGYGDAITDSEKEGYELFKTKGCITCHNGMGVGGNSYQKFGLAKPYDKDPHTQGRYDVTKEEKDKFVFKVPLLRNIELTAPYFHDASTWDLSEAVNVMTEYQLGISLSNEENEKIVAFLKTLTGEQPQIVLPILPLQRRQHHNQIGIDQTLCVSMWAMEYESGAPAHRHAHRRTNPLPRAAQITERNAHASHG